MCTKVRHVDTKFRRHMWRHILFTSPCCQIGNE